MSVNSRRSLPSRIGVTASIRRYKLRRIQSGEPIKTNGSPPFPKYHTRACSKKLSTIRVTRIFRLNDSPGTRQQIPLTIKSICTPASLARYSSSIIAVSCKAFIFKIIRPGFPSFTKSISCWIRAFNSGSRLNRAINRRLKRGSVTSFRKTLNRVHMSSTICLLQVYKAMSA